MARNAFSFYSALGSRFKLYFTQALPWQVSLGSATHYLSTVCICSASEAHKRHVDPLLFNASACLHTLTLWTWLVHSFYSRVITWFWAHRNTAVISWTYSTLMGVMSKTLLVVFHLEVYSNTSQSPVMADDTSYWLPQHDLLYCRFFKFYIEKRLKKQKRAH